MSIQDVVVMRREKLGKEETNRLRKTGQLPCVVYGMGGESLPIAVEPKIINTIIRSEKGLNTVLNLRLHGTDQTRHVMIKSVDRHPVTDRLSHVDFMRINMEAPVTAIIPLNFIGAAEGVKLGGTLTLVRHELEIECMPKHLLGSITVDVSGLGLDEALRIQDLPAFEGVTFKLGPTRTIAVCHVEKAPILDEEGDA